MQSTFEKLPKQLKKDEVFIFPTDTVMGVGCRMDSEAAIQRLYKLKNRPVDQPTAVLVSHVEMARMLMSDTDIEPELQVIMKKYWPGELTIIVKSSDIVPSTITGQTDLIGIRITDHRKLQKFISDIGIPVVATSANFKGGTTPCKFSDIDPNFISLVDYFVNEDSYSDKASTVIKYLGKGKFEYVRKGGVNIVIN